jgi:large subunit ribosomal protein L22
MKAKLESHNQSERKVRLVANLVKGKSVPAALAALEFLPKRAALPVKKLIESAAANAKQEGKNPDDLKVKNVIVENAGYIARYMPRAFGRASMIRRRKSRVKVELA